MNKSNASFLFLGTGGSMGVPVIGCSCPVCRSPSAFDHRFRPSGLIKINGKQFLIDPGPDFRDQALQFGIDHLDGVLITHTHFDHIGGLDDLRAFHFIHKKQVIFLCSKESYQEVRIRFHYLFEDNPKNTLAKVPFVFHFLDEEYGSVSFQQVNLRYCTYYQGGMKVTGFRLGSFAYISDIRDYDERLMDFLDQTEILVLSALRYNPSHVHFSIEEAIAFSRRVKAQKTYFTHIAHDLDHEETNRKLPQNICLAFDGLELFFNQ